MRYIRQNGEPPLEWREKAKEINDLLEAATSEEERQTIIKDNAKHWGKLKEWLLDLSHRKCWYSESHESYSHLDVDHFRPKGKPIRKNGEEDAESYWWLAFDWKNYRVCGNVGNRKKGAYFPLREGSCAATCANRNLDDEVPYFLDPTVASDVALLDFNEDGRVSCLEGSDAWEQARVTETIERMKLDFSALEDSRKKIYNRCNSTLQECIELRKKLGANQSSAINDRLKEKGKLLVEMVSPESPFSAVAISCLLKSGDRWAQRIASASTN